METESAPAVILDTNVFVAAGFNRRSSSARLLDQLHRGRLRMVWNDDTRRETGYILSKIPPLSWDRVAPLFRDDDRYQGQLDTADLNYIADPDDRKYLALALATGALLISNDDHLLSVRNQTTAKIVTPAEYWRQHDRPH